METRKNIFDYNFLCYNIIIIYKGDNKKMIKKFKKWWNDDGAEIMSPKQEKQIMKEYEPFKKNCYFEWVKYVMKKG